MKKNQGDEWQSDPEITMKIGNPFTWKDWLEVSGLAFVCAIPSIVIYLLQI